MAQIHYEENHNIIVNDFEHCAETEKLPSSS